MSPDRMTAAVHHLLVALTRPDAVTGLDLAGWDALVRVARQTRLIGILDDRMASAGLLGSVPTAARGHLEAARNLSLYRAQMLRLELRELARALDTRGVPTVLLKGAAYVMTDHPAARGRLPGDVDLMVPRSALPDVERRLVSRGWESTVTDAYDQRYYREWSHELPPMHFPGREVEVDLHHAICPPTSRTSPPPDLLFDASVEVTGTPWRVLSPVDQVIHVALHLFQDSELDGRIRELVDFHALATTAARDARDWDALFARAETLGASRALVLAVTQTRSLLDREFAADATRHVPRGSGNGPIDRILSLALLPLPLDGPVPSGMRAARRFGTARYHWLRMPPGLLARHLATKAVRRVVARFDPD